MTGKPTLAESCLSCVDSRMLGCPSLRNVWPNAERFRVPYAIAGAIMLVLITFLSSWLAFLPVLSLLFLLPVLHYQSDEGLKWAVGVIVAVPHALFVLVMWFVVGGNFARPAGVFVLGVAAGVLHASCRQAGHDEGDIEMAYVAESDLKQGEDLSVLEEFRRHSQSVKEKYGLQ